MLGVKEVELLEISGNMIGDQPLHEVNARMSKVVNDFNPHIVLCPYPDRHIDHKLIFESCMVCTRPTGKFWPKLVLSYETLSETDWNAPYIEPHFIPEWFIDIDDHLENKLKALNCYQSQITDNSSRNEEAVKALAKYRGSQNGFQNAEGFKLIRCMN